MDRPALMALVVAFLVVLLLLMVWGWRGRRRRQAHLPDPITVAELPAQSARFDVFYVATTHAGDQLDRIAVGGLGFRARAVVAVASDGVVLAIPGQRPIFIPAFDVTAVAPATWTIDRVVETGGLIRLSWMLRDEHSTIPVDSYVRAIAPEDAPRLMSALHPMLTPSSPIGDAR